MKKSIILACLPLLALTSCGSAKALTPEEAQERYSAVKTKSQDIDLTKNYKISGQITQKAIEDSDVAFEASNDPEGNYYGSIEVRYLEYGKYTWRNTKAVCLKSKDVCYVEVKDESGSRKLKYPYNNDVTNQFDYYCSWNDKLEGTIAQADTILTSSQAFLSGVVTGFKYTLAFDTPILDISIFSDDDVVTKFEMEGGGAKGTFSLAYLDELTITAPSDANSYNPAPTV